MHILDSHLSRCLRNYFSPIIFVTILLVLVGFPSTCMAVDVGGWTVGECVKCHSFQVRMVSTDGGMHAEEVSCVDCHPGHPPGEERMTLDCVDCHEGRTHFTIGDCLNCHVDPHRPLVTLRDTPKPAKKECLSCHADIGAEMVTFPGLHAELYCTHCHKRHKEIPGCQDCHASHEQTQSDAACVQCHSPHSPGKVVLKGHIKASFCRTCHKQEADDLAGTNTNHVGLNCTYCHKDFHPNIPKCQDCHGLPHNQSLHSQFRDCLECHGSAHRMISNN